jgi:hypothetical protein
MVKFGTEDLHIAYWAIVIFMKIDVVKAITYLMA